MQTMKKYIYIIMAMALTSAMVGCQTFEPVEPFKPATEADLEADGYTHVSVNNLKDLYYNRFSNATGQKVELTDKLYIKCKVISSDELGNVYRSMFVQDAEGSAKGGIEVKVGKGSLYTYYKMGQIVFIKTDGLILGDYNGTLSLGGRSSDESYANGHIDIQTTIDEKILRGEVVGLNDNDYLELNSTNAASVIADKYSNGTLLKITDAVSTYGSHKVGNNTNNFPYVHITKAESPTGSAQFINMGEMGKFGLKKETPDEEGVPNTWAYCYNNKNFYGNALFMVGDSAVIVRTSGYSRFALNPLPENGAVVDMIAIMNMYNGTVQLTLNTDEDVVEK